MKYVLALCLIILVLGCVECDSDQDGVEWKHPRGVARSVGATPKPVHISNPFFLDYKQPGREKVDNTDSLNDIDEYTRRERARRRKARKDRERNSNVNYKEPNMRRYGLGYDQAIYASQGLHKRLEKEKRERWNAYLNRHKYQRRGRG